MERHDCRRCGGCLLQRLLLNSVADADLVGSSRHAGSCSKVDGAYDAWIKRRDRCLCRLFHRGPNPRAGFAPLAHAVCRHRLRLRGVDDAGRNWGGTNLGVGVAGGESHGTRERVNVSISPEPIFK